jgi:hypothetical protein
LLKAAGGAQSPLPVLQLRHLGGALARATETDGPTGAIHEPYQLFCLGIPVTPDVTAAVTASFGAIREALSGHLTGRRTFNFLADSDDPTDALSQSALTRLASVKQTVDPHGTFRSNRPVCRTRG